MKAAKNDIKLSSDSKEDVNLKSYVNQLAESLFTIRNRSGQIARQHNICYRSVLKSPQ